MNKCLFTKDGSASLSFEASPFDFFFVLPPLIVQSLPKSSRQGLEFCVVKVMKQTELLAIVVHHSTSGLCIDGQLFLAHKAPTGHNLLRGRKRQGVFLELIKKVGLGLLILASDLLRKDRKKWKKESFSI